MPWMKGSKGRLNRCRPERTACLQHLCTQDKVLPVLWFRAKLPVFYTLHLAIMDKFPMKMLCSRFSCVLQELHYELSYHSLLTETTLVADYPVYKVLRIQWFGHLVILFNEKLSKILLFVLTTYTKVLHWIKVYLTWIFHNFTIHRNSSIAFLWDAVTLTIKLTVIYISYAEGSVFNVWHWVSFINSHAEHT